MARAVALALLLLAACAPCAAGLVANATHCLALHNTYRAKHRAPALKWNATLAAGAQAW